MLEAKEWHRISELGSGGQSTVFLVRTPARAAELASASAQIGFALQGSAQPGEFISAVRTQLRADATHELGALKIFDKVREGGAAPEARIHREIEILEAKFSNLPKLLASNAAEKWMITEYFPRGTLEKSGRLFMGDAKRALIAFRTLVETVATLHKMGVVHRDIKPANVFVTDTECLIPGDFGIAHRSTATERLTVTHERVGPWDYMPQWADTGERLDEVRASFDVYMLGKLLWCMTSGRLRLPREYHRRPQYDLTAIFPNVPMMNDVNLILDRCLVEHEHECFTSAVELLSFLDETVAHSHGALRVSPLGQVELPCYVCGRGLYKEETMNGRVQLSRMTSSNQQQQPIYVRVFSCNVCTHRAFFAPGFPDEAVTRAWKTS